jgi:small subunit ribosomal protein S20
MGKASSLSTKKRLRQSKKRQARNKSNKTRLKTQIKKFRGAVETGNANELRKVTPETFSVIDKAVKKGVLHKNAAARYKSRLSKLASKPSGQ